MSTGERRDDDNASGALHGSAGVVRWAERHARALLVTAAVTAGAGLSAYWLLNKPAPERRAPQARARLVEVSRVSLQSHAITVGAMGTVVPARSIQLAARVSGHIVEVSPELVPGGRFAAGQRILRVDRQDYQLAVQQRSSELARARSDLKLEMGQQSVSEQEYRLLAREVQEEDKELLLRQPQLVMAQAAVAAAEAALEKARLDLARADVLAPFNAVVQSRSVDLGSHVTAGMALASLVGTDAFWVQVSVPVDALKWIELPAGEQAGSAVRVVYESAWGPGAHRTGVVARLMTDVEPEGRMVRLLVAVEDPLDTRADPASRRPLILGSYVRAEIQGRELPGAVRVPRTALRDGQRVWVMQPDSSLDIREARVEWSGDDHVLVTAGLADGELLVTSDLPAPVQGMALRTAEQDDGDAAPPESRQSRAEGSAGAAR